MHRLSLSITLQPSGSSLQFSTFFLLLLHIVNENDTTLSLTKPQIFNKGFRTRQWIHSCQCFIRDTAGFHTGHLSLESTKGKRKGEEKISEWSCAPSALCMNLWYTHMHTVPLYSTRLAFLRLEKHWCVTCCWKLLSLLSFFHIFTFLCSCE